MQLNRREFLLLTAGLAGGCATGGGDDSMAPTAARSINAGAVTGYAAEGVYKNFREEGFFLIRRGGKLFALSSICTHRHCKLTAERDGSFYCPCHGSTFDSAGHVIEGPARRDLPIFEAVPNEQGELVVNVPAM